MIIKNSEKNISLLGSFFSKFEYVVSVDDGSEPQSIIIGFCMSKIEFNVRVMCSMSVSITSALE